jgi:uncharacterized protein (DUF849 family)
MAKNERKVIINCAVTGAIHVPSQSDYLPITPQQIADEAVRAANAGAATVHLHVRDPKTGEPTMDLGLFREVCQEVSRRSDVVVCITTGGHPLMTPEERMVGVKTYGPELASINMGSMNFGLFPAMDRIKEYKWPWEKDYLERSKDMVFKNTFYDQERILKIMNDHGTKPEMECYDVAHLYNTAHWVDKKALAPPLWLQLIFGILGGIQPSVENLVFMKNTADKLFGDDYVWSILPVGRYQFSLGTVAVVMGGNVRVGLEDNLYLGKGKFLTSNEDAVRKIRRIVEQELDIPIATPDEAREILKLKGKKNTKF